MARRERTQAELSTAQFDTLEKIDEAIGIVLVNMRAKDLAAVDNYLIHKMNMYEAYEAAFKPKTATAKKNVSQHAYAFFKKVDVVRYQALLKKRLAISCNVTLEEVVHKYRALHKLTSDPNSLGYNPSTAAVCIQGLAKTAGLLQPDIKIGDGAEVTLNFNFAAKTPVGLRKEEKVIQGEVVNPDDML